MIFLTRIKMHNFAALQLSTHRQGSIPSFSFAECNPLYQARTVKDMKHPLPVSTSTDHLPRLYVHQSSNALDWEQPLMTNEAHAI
jgi:hypothetical protein